MSYLSSQGQLSGVLPYPVEAGGAGAGVADVLISQVIPLGKWLVCTQVTFAGAGVTSGLISASYQGAVVTGSRDTNSGAGQTSSVCFPFVSNGATPLILSATGGAAAWTSGATTLVCMPIP